MEWHNSRLEFDLDNRDGLGRYASFAKNLGLAKTVLVLFLSLSSRVQMKAREAQNLPFAFSVYDDGQCVQLWSKHLVFANSLNSHTHTIILLRGSRYSLFFRTFGLKPLFRSIKVHLSCFGWWEGKSVDSKRLWSPSMGESSIAKTSPSNRSLTLSFFAFTMWRKVLVQTSVLDSAGRGITLQT